MLGAASDKIIIGYDLGNVFSQISYSYLSQDSEVETLSCVAGEEHYNIPTVLCKRQGTGQWFFGREALRFSEEYPQEAILVENLVELAAAGEQVPIDGENYEPVALLTLFMKRSLGLLSLVSAPERIVAMMITSRKLDSLLIQVLNQTVTGLGLGYTRVYYQSYAESFYDYMLYQPRDLWTFQTVLFDYREDGIYSMRMECNKRTTPVVAYVHQRIYPFCGESCLPDISGLEEGRLAQLDQELLQVVRQECEKGTVSSVYLIGEGFAGEWMPQSLQYLCKGSACASPLARRQEAFSDFVAQILSYVGLYDSETVLQVEETLKAGSGLSDYEKMKLQTDHLAEQKRYEEALKSYDRLLARIRENQEMEVPALQALTADILHNKGVIYARQMLYGQAAEYCYQAWKTSGEQQAYFADYLAARRMQLPERDYVALVAECPEQYRASLELERSLEVTEQTWRDTPEYKRLAQLRARRAGGEMSEYCEETERILQALKSDYRKRSDGKRVSRESLA